LQVTLDTSSQLPVFSGSLLSAIKYGLVCCRPIRMNNVTYLLTITQLSGVYQEWRPQS